MPPSMTATVTTRLKCHLSRKYVQTEIIGPQTEKIWKNVFPHAKVQNMPLPTFVLPRSLQWWQQPQQQQQQPWQPLQLDAGCWMDGNEDDDDMKMMMMMRMMMMMVVEPVIGDLCSRGSNVIVTDNDFYMSINITFSPVLNTAKLILLYYAINVSNRTMACSNI